MQVVAGENHTCVRRASGAVQCWGDASKGVLGDGTAPETYVNAPIPVDLGVTTARCNATLGAPGAEVCADRIDNDCNGAVDDGC